MKKVALILVGLFEHYEGMPWYIMAWTAGDRIYVRRPFHRIFFARARLAHEIWHWHLNVGNEAHHSAWHLCVFSPYGIRTFDDRCTRETEYLVWLHDQAEVLRRTGVVEVP